MLRKLGLLLFYLLWETSAARHVFFLLLTVPIAAAVSLISQTPGLLGYREIPAALLNYINLFNRKELIKGSSSLKEKKLELEAVHYQFKHPLVIADSHKGNSENRVYFQRLRINFQRLLG